MRWAENCRYCKEILFRFVVQNLSVCALIILYVSFRRALTIDLKIIACCDKKLSFCECSITAWSYKLASLSLMLSFSNIIAITHF